MNDIKLWCKLICIISIVSGVLLSLLPKSKLDTAFRGLVSVLLVFCFVYPLGENKNLFKNISFISSNAVISEEDMFVNNSNIIVDCAEELLEQQLNEVIVAVNSDGRCKAYIAQTDGVAYIEKVEVYGSFSDREVPDIRLQIQNLIGGDADIEFVR